MEVGLCECGCGQQPSIAKKTSLERGDIKGKPRRFLRGHNNRLIKPHGRLALPLEQRFWEKVDRSGECWLWMGTRYKTGYGQIKVKDKTLKAYRVAYELTYGPIPKGLMICHKCDNPPCVRPDHLFSGTGQENHDDQKTKGRTLTGDRNWTRIHPERVRRGEKATKAKLTESQVRAIYSRILDGERPYSLAREYGVTYQTIYSIVVGKSWRHLNIVSR